MLGLRSFEFAVVFACICLCLLVGCSMVRGKRVTEVVTPVFHSHYQLLSAQSTLSIAKALIDDGRATPAVRTQYNNAVPEYNEASKLWEDYNLAVRVHGNVSWVSKRFVVQVSKVVDMAGVLKQSTLLIPPPPPLQPAKFPEDKK